MKPERDSEQSGGGRILLLPALDQPVTVFRARADDSLERLAAPHLVLPALRTTFDSARGLPATQPPAEGPWRGRLPVLRIHPSLPRLRATGEGLWSAQDGPLRIVHFYSEGRELRAVELRPSGDVLLTDERITVELDGAGATIEARLQAGTEPGRSLATAPWLFVRRALVALRDSLS